MTERPPEQYSRRAELIENIGIIIGLLGVLALVATIPSWFEFGQWTAVLTWTAGIGLGLAVLGWTLSTIGYRWNERARARYAAWLASLRDRS